MWDLVIEGPEEMIVGTSQRFATRKKRFNPLVGLLLCPVVSKAFPSKERGLLAPFLALDACFKLRRRFYGP